MDESQVFQPILKSGEELRWTGRPAAQFSFSTTDYVRLVVEIVFLGVFIGFARTFIKSAPGFFGPIPYVFAAVAVVFALFGALAGPLSRFRALKSSSYAVTDKRVIIYASGSARSRELGEIQSLGKNLRSDGSGTVTFGSMPDAPSWAIGAVPFEFANIPDADGVYHLISGLMRGSEQHGID